MAVEVEHTYVIWMNNLILYHSNVSLNGINKDLYIDLKYLHIVNLKCKTAIASYLDVLRLL